MNATEAYERMTSLISDYHTGYITKDGCREKIKKLVADAKAEGIPMMVTDEGLDELLDSIVVTTTEESYESSYYESY